MTNITAIKSTEKNGNEEKEALLFVTDSMSSYMAKPEKNDRQQKLHQIGDFLVCSTGYTELALDTAARLMEDSFSSVDQVSDAILKITHGYGLTPDDGLNFIVGGKGKKGLELRHINTTGNYKHINGIADYSKRGFREGQFFFDGSAEFFVTQYLKGLGDAGKIIPIDNHVESFGLLYDISMAGAINTGVNDKLQIGVITPEKASLLYDPDVSLELDSWPTYVKNSIGVDVELMDWETDYGKELEKKKLYSEKITSVFNRFYQDIIGDMKSFSAAKKWYTYETERFLRDYTNLEQIQTFKEDLLMKKANVAKGFDAIKQNSLESKLNYIADYNARQDAKSASLKKSLQNAK